MNLDLVYRVTCDGEPMYFGLDEALAQRIYDHLANTPGHAATLERAELAWWRVNHSPITEGST